MPEGLCLVGGSAQDGPGLQVTGPNCSGLGRVQGSWPRACTGGGATQGHVVVARPLPTPPLSFFYHQLPGSARDRWRLGLNVHLDQPPVVGVSQSGRQACP